jgi:hypothetical protein
LLIFVIIEGALHDFGPCARQKTNGQFSDAVKNLFDNIRDGRPSGYEAAKRY